MQELQQMQEENPTEELRLKFIVRIFFSEGSNFSICKYRILEKDKKENEEDGPEVVCKGYGLPVDKDMEYVMEGSWTNSSRHGPSFTVKTYKMVMPDTRKSIVKYLSGKQFTGIGKKTAERIYDVFREETIHVIMEDPEQLRIIHGLSTEKIMTLHDVMASSKGQQEVLQYLLPFGFSPSVISIAIEKLDLHSVNDIKRNPYRLYTVSGVSIEMADRVASGCGFPRDGKSAIRAHARDVLFKNELEGNTCMEASAFGTALIRSMNCTSINRDTVTAAAVSLVRDGKITCRKTMYNGDVIRTFALPAMDKMETENTKKLHDLSAFKQQVRNELGLNSYITRFCKKEDIELDDIQKSAFKNSVCSSVSIITGGPGMGKTTIIKLIASYIRDVECKEPVFMAPSGRAARRITESTGFAASTIHHAIGLRPDISMDAFSSGRDCDFVSTTVIVDEFSMLDTYVFHCLLQCINVGCRLICVGDPNQLQSVGAGAVLRDMINSGVIPCTELKHIYRQSEGSMIAANAYNIVHGIHDVRNGSDFTIHVCEDMLDMENKMVERYMEITGGAVEKLRDVFCLCPVKMHTAGVYSMNRILHEKLNPLGRTHMEVEIGGQTYRQGDIVMSLVNETDFDVSNGDIGTVLSVDIINHTMEVEFGDKEKPISVTYSSEQKDHFTLAYAFTVHKSQGSENKNVLVGISHTAGYRMLRRSLLNTAITRGSEHTELFVLNDGAVDIAIDNDDSALRMTHMCDNLKKAFGEFVPV